MDCSMPDSSVLHYLPQFAQIHVHWVSDAIQPSHSMSPPSAALNLSSIRFFSSESPLHIRWPKYWSFSFSINIQGWFPLGLISLISLLSKELSRVFSSTMVLKHWFFGIQPSLWSKSHLYMMAGKSIALTMWTFVSKVMFLPCNMLSMFVTAFLPRSKHLNFMAIVTIHSDFGTQEKKICHYFHCFPIYLPWNDGTRCHDLSFLNVEF